MEWLTDLLGDKVKLIVIGVILALIGGGIVAYKYKAAEVVKLNKEVAVDKVVNGSLADTVKNDIKVEKVNADANTNLAIGTTTVAKGQDKVISNMWSKVRDTERAAKLAASSSADIPLPVETLEAKIVRQTTEDTATSTIMVNVLWDAFCEGSPNSDSCKPPVQGK